MDDKGNDGENLGDTGKDDKDMGDRGNEGKGMDDKDNDFVAMDPKGMDGMCMDDKDNEDAGKDGIDMDDVHMQGKGIDNKGMAGSDLNEYMEYLEIVKKTFRTEEEAYMFYVGYARKKGFGVRKDDLKYRGPGPKQNAYRRTYKCCKQGWRALKHFNRAERKRTPRGLSRCGCPALFQVELQDSSGLWFVKNFVDKHNHLFVPADLTPYLSAHRRMTDAQKADVIEYAVGGLRTHQIMNVMEKNARGPDKLGFIDRDLYNHVSIQKKRKIEGSDARYLLTYMIAQKKSRPGILFQIHKRQRRPFEEHILG
jgi:hypothetical protein